MIDLILVDDDPILLDGLERSFPWHDMQYRIVGTARNGREALQLIERRHPQVVLTDIRMPDMDGIGLLKTVHSVQPHVKFVLISAYSDFAYARDALSYGAEAYILKLDLFDELEEVMRRVAKEVIRTQETEKSSHSLRMQTLLEFLQGGEKPPWLEEEKYWCAVRLRGCEKEEAGAKLERAGLQVHCAQREAEWVLAAGADMVSGRAGTLREEMEGILLTLWAGPGVRITLGGVYAGCDGLRRSYLESGHLMDLCRWEGTYGVFTRYQIPKKQEGRGDGEEWMALSLNEQVTEEYLEKCLEEYLASPEMGREFFSQQCLMVLLKYQEHQRRNGQSISNASEQVAAIMEAESPVDKMEMCLEFVREISRQMKEPGAAQKFQEVLRFVDTNFAMALSAAEVADRFGMTYHAFLKRFREEKGQGFPQYLKEIRLSHARRLLEKTERNVGEIAQECGFQDEKYFMKTFKEQFGLTPTEYRMAKRQKE